MSYRVETLYSNCQTMSVVSLNPSKQIRSNSSSYTIIVLNFLDHDGKVRTAYRILEKRNSIYFNTWSRNGREFCSVWKISKNLSKIVCDFRIAVCPRRLNDSHISILSSFFPRFSYESRWIYGHTLRYNKRRHCLTTSLCLYPYSLCLRMHMMYMLCSYTFSARHMRAIYDKSNTNGQTLWRNSFIVITPHLSIYFRKTSYTVLRNW